MRVLLVDDEPFITQGLKLLIDWKAEDCEIAGCVKNGKEALEFLKKEKADLVLCSHEHGDHNASELIDVSEAKQNTVLTITEFVCPHDDAGGSKRGLNKIHIIDDGELKVAHMGDVGTTALENDALDALYGCDLLLIPVGGHYTVDAAEAKALVDRIAPRVTVPMHYRSAYPAFGFGVLATVHPFLDLFDESEVLRADSPSFTLSGTSPRLVIVPAFPF